MGLTYFKRFQMEFDLSASLPASLPVPPGYELVPFTHDLIREHATAKYQSFRMELDANVFPCLGRRDGCLRLMREISSRAGFVPAATWLCRYRDLESNCMLPVGTVQGLHGERLWCRSESWHRSAPPRAWPWIDLAGTSSQRVSRSRFAKNALGSHNG